jgi:uncharacterized membrane protein YbaN (DUF454 family)
MTEPIKRLTFFLLGWGFVVLGVFGMFLPVLPTTPFLLLAASCFVRSSQRSRRLLLRNRWFGPMLREWEERRAVRRSVKRLAYVANAGVIAFAFLRDVHWGVRLAIVSLCAVGFIVLRRLPTAEDGEGQSKANAETRGHGDGRAETDEGMIG